MTSAMFYKATNLIKITIEDFTVAALGPVLLRNFMELLHSAAHTYLGVFEGGSYQVLCSSPAGTACAFLRCLFPTQPGSTCTAFPIGNGPKLFQAQGWSFSAQLQVLLSCHDLDSSC